MLKTYTLPNGDFTIEGWIMPDKDCVDSAHKAVDELIDSVRAQAPAIRASIIGVDVYRQRPVEEMIQAKRKADDTAMKLKTLLTFVGELLDEAGVSRTEHSMTSALQIARRKFAEMSNTLQTHRAGPLTSIPEAEAKQLLPGEPYLVLRAAVPGHVWLAENLLTGEQRKGWDEFFRSAVQPKVSEVWVSKKIRKDEQGSEFYVPTKVVVSAVAKDESRKDGQLNVVYHLNTDPTMVASRDLYSFMDRYTREVASPT